MPARDISVLYRNKADMSRALLNMFRDFAVNYKDNVVHARNIFDKYRAVIDHSKDIVAMSGNKCVLTLLKADNYSDLLIQTLYIAAKYMRDGTMYMRKMPTLPISSASYAINPYPCHCNITKNEAISSIIRHPKIQIVNQIRNFNVYRPEDNMMIKNYFCVIAMLLASAIAIGQDRHDPTAQNYLKMRWTTVATQMPSAWYNTDEAKRVAENVLVSQKDIGSWVKNQPYHHVFSDSLRTYYKSTKNDVGGTFDNGSTISELRFLAKVYTHFKDQRYRDAFMKGVDYIFMAQYDNGGWPQFYPVRDAGVKTRPGRTVPYSMHITYNDNAMVNIMNFIKDIYADVPEFAALEIATNTKDKARKAFDRGIACILKTQIRVDSTPTVWCAQHHYKTLAPVKARSYELESFSGSESVGIVALLMAIDNPSPAVIAAVDGACTWFEEHQIAGIRVERQTDSHGNRNTVIVADREAPPIWARFYDLETGKPYFCDRDGIKKYALDEIGAERRNGYSWYTNAPQRVLDAQPQWHKKWGGD